ncbi:signal peptidase I [Polymorphospora sp. NPDC050346]|uniref:signal peptidase I n=1 Tax=Polymorphospora sp. NPDC050346 TaxID=3155780 RepID=UPI0033C4E3DF
MVPAPVGAVTGHLPHSVQGRKTCWHGPPAAAQGRCRRRGVASNREREPVTVPEDTVFVMGDDRAISRDSRAYGPVPDGDVTGRVVTRLWPLG